MPDKKPSLIVSLLSKKGKEPGDSKEPMPGGMDDDMAEGSDEGLQLASAALDAMKSDDPQALYDAICGIVDSHMDKGEPMSPGMSPESAPDESSY
jgi:hypothetical protein